MRSARFTGALNPWNWATRSNLSSHAYNLFVVTCNYTNYSVFFIYILFDVSCIYALFDVFIENIIYDVFILICGET